MAYLDLSHEVLTLSYTEWKKALTEINLTDEEKKWLSAWELYDLALSPMDDNERISTRVGHYYGRHRIKIFMCRHPCYICQDCMWLIFG